MAESLYPRSPKHRSLGWRVASVLILAACGLAVGTATIGCAWWQQEPKQPQTVKEWMDMPRVEP